MEVNVLNAELNPICHLLALLGAHHILHVSRILVNGQVEERASWLHSRSAHFGADGRVLPLPELTVNENERNTFERFFLELCEKDRDRELCKL